MWNRQREAEEAREKLALAGDDEQAPHRRPPAVDEDAPEPIDPGVAPADAAE
jgi:ATP-binding cassette subfamily B protein